MDEYKGNIIKSILFVLTIIGLLVGGYFLIKNYQPKKTKEKTKSIIESKITKIDDTKEYIYFENYKVIASEPDITYKDVVINIVGNESLNKALKTEMDAIRTTVKYISDNKLDSSKEVLYDEENIYSAEERNYEIYNTFKYISLVIKDYEFNCYDGPIFTNGKSYVYNKSDGSLIEPNKLLEMYNTNIDKVHELIKTSLNKLQIESDEVEINVEETLNDLKVFYYINYKGLNVSYLVKTEISNTLENLVIE